MGLDEVSTRPAYARECSYRTTEHRHVTRFFSDEVRHQISKHLFKSRLGATKTPMPRIEQFLNIGDHNVRLAS
jgi:hypothetical protein